jgi:hypothetical protein
MAARARLRPDGTASTSGTHQFVPRRVTTTLVLAGRSVDDGDHLDSDLADRTIKFMRSSEPARRQADR